MNRGKIIVIAGTDCSGKETQSKKLLERLNNDGIKTELMAFPRYDTPTGKIVGGPYLGKSYICEGWFPEGAPNVDPKVSCLYYAADRRAALDEMNEILNSGANLLLDRYTTANMGHQGGKIKDKNEREEMFKWIENLEYEMLGLPRPDITIFLYMPLEYSKKLKGDRFAKESADQHESNEEHLKLAENSYLHLVDLYKWNQINCTNNEEVRSIDDISNDVYNTIVEKLNNK